MIDFIGLERIKDSYKIHMDFKEFEWIVVEGFEILGGEVGFFLVLVIYTFGSQIPQNPQLIEILQNLNFLNTLRFG